MQGTGSAPYNAPQLQPVNETAPDKINLSKMYNLKDLHDKKIRGNAPAGSRDTMIHDLQGADTNNSTTTNSITAKPSWTPNDKLISDMFAGYSVNNEG